MTAIAFYYVQKTPLERVVVTLLERTLAQDKRALIVCPSDAAMQTLSRHLWVLKAESWLPHGFGADANDDAPHTPIWMNTDSRTNPNGADYLFVTHAARDADPAAFTRCFEIFDSRDETALTVARAHWKEWKGAGHTLTWWAQDDAGKWKEQS